MPSLREQIEECVLDWAASQGDGSGKSTWVSVSSIQDCQFDGRVDLERLVSELEQILLHV